MAQSNNTHFKDALRALLEDYPTELPEDVSIVEFANYYEVFPTPMGYAIQAYQVIREEMGL